MHARKVVASCLLCVCVCVQVWASLAENPAFSSDREACFRWFAKVGLDVLLCGCPAVWLSCPAVWLSCPVVWMFCSLVPRPSPSFPSLAVRLSGRGPGTFSQVTISDVSDRKPVERLLIKSGRTLLHVFTFILEWQRY